jgi:nitrile hydratase subunit alpha
MSCQALDLGLYKRGGDRFPVVGVASLCNPRKMGEETPFKPSRRNFLAAAATVAGAAVRPDFAQSEEAHDHAHQAVPSDVALRVRALESLLVEKGLVDPSSLDALVDAYEHKLGPRSGARVIARAWVDPSFKARLIADATAAIAELGFMSEQGERIIALQNMPNVHNLVVCTLCSCYPWPLLGLPPRWYKSAPYRSRAVIDPRGLLREFGLDLPAGVDVRVWDSTAEVRYIVIPEQPPGSEALGEQELAALVTRDTMVGIAKVSIPLQTGAV